MPQTDTQIMLQRLPTGWTLYNGGQRLASYGEQLPTFTQAERDAQVLSRTKGGNNDGGYWRQTRWRPGSTECTQYVWVQM